MTIEATKVSQQSTYRTLPRSDLPANQRRAKRRSGARSARPPQGVDGHERGASITRVGASAANAEASLDAPHALPLLGELALPAETELRLAESPLRGLARRPLGNRLGELLALDVAAVDLDGGWIHVHRSWDRGTKQFIPTKSRKPRSVPIIDKLAVLLADHFVLIDHPSEGLLFPSANNPDWPTDAGILRRRTHARWSKAGLKPLGFHEGRHTYASIGIAAGLNPKTLSTYLGHATITITLDRYGHLMPGSEVEACNLLNTYLDDPDRL